MAVRKVYQVPNGVQVALEGSGYKLDPVLSAPDLSVWLHPVRAMRAEVSGATTPGLDRVFLKLALVDPADMRPTRGKIEFLSSDEAIRKIREAVA